MGLNRIVFLGNNEIGKAEAIKCLSASNIERNREYQYGMIDFGEAYQLQLVDVVDPRVISKLHQRTNESNLGFILLIDNAKENYLKHLITIIDFIKPYFQETGIAIGILNNKEHLRQLEKINSRLREIGVKAPVFEVEPNKREDIAKLVEALLISIDYQLSTIH